MTISKKSLVVLGATAVLSLGLFGSANATGTGENYIKYQSKYDVIFGDNVSQRRSGAPVILSNKTQPHKNDGGTGSNYIKYQELYEKLWK